MTPSAPKILYWDIETADADALFTGIVDAGTDKERPVEGPFVRLMGYAWDDDPVTITTDPEELMAALEEADETWGHNTFGFDGLAMAWHHKLDWQTWCAKSFDTDPLARYDFPPRSREKGSADQYDLDHVAQRYGLVGKITGEDGLAALKRRYKGYDRIPTDDPAYRAYLEQDVIASRSVAGVLRRALNDYTRREHKLLYYTGQMTLNGFHVNQSLLQERIKEGQERKRDALQTLNQRYAIPLGKTVLRGRKPNKTEHFVPDKAPLATRHGKDALIKAFWELGVRHYPKVDKTFITHPVTGMRIKDIAAGREGMEKLAAHYAVKRGLTGVQDLCDLVTTVTTVRTIYQTAANNLAPDGKIHPRASMRQASGRLSVTPGMTVFGKHAGRHVEREIFDAEEGRSEPYVLITCDLAQVDMRAVAAHSQDPNYMDLFGWEEDGTQKDAHQLIADMLGIKRQDAKARGHGWNYGLGANRMIKEGADPKVVYTFVNGMERRFRRLCEWREEVRDTGKAGEFLDNGFGRPMRCDPRFAYTQAPALMGQGTARDITMEVLIRLLEAHPEYVYYLRNQVHDEWVFCVPASRAEEIKGHIVDAFTWSWRNVPILCDAAGPGANWGELSAK